MSLPAKNSYRADVSEPATLGSLRTRIEQELRGDADLTAFCLDHFPDVAKRFSLGMDRVQKVNILFEQADAVQILAALDTKRRTQPLRVLRSPSIRWTGLALGMAVIAGLAYQSARLNPGSSSPAAIQEQPALEAPPTSPATPSLQPAAP